jgi:hypothetical protein
MSAPSAVADRAEEVVPGVWHWSLHDERIDFVGSSHAISAPEGTVLIDPHALAEDALARLGPVAAICLTAGSHQRAAWRYRDLLGVPVHAPAGVREVEEEPDVRYSEGDRLPGGLVPVFTPGAGTTQHTLLLGGEPAVAFVPDLLVLPPGGRLGLVPDRFLHDPDEARRSVRKLLELPFDVLCLGHGAPVLESPKDAVRAVLEG